MKKNNGKLNNNNSHN